VYLGGWTNEFCMLFSSVRPLAWEKADLLTMAFWDGLAEVLRLLDEGRAGEGSQRKAVGINSDKLTYQLAGQQFTPQYRIPYLRIVSHFFSLSFYLQALSLQIPADPISRAVSEETVEKPPRV
jgi:hypothetical protein